MVDAESKALITKKSSKRFHVLQVWQTWTLQISMQKQVYLIQQGFTAVDVEDTYQQFLIQV